VSVPAPTSSGLRAVVADDDVDIVGLLRDDLERSGYAVEHAYDGIQALELVRRRRPDVALFDVVMPGLDGFELTRRVRAAPETRDVPVILLTALHDGERAAAGLAAGADDYVKKPFSLSELRARISAVVARSQGERFGAGDAPPEAGDELARENALARLLATRRMRSALQPIWDLQAGALLGYEALARPHRGFGFAGPGEAFAVAERLQCVPELCELGREAALARARELPAGVLLFINMAPESLARGGDVTDRFAASVRAAGLTPGRVVVEITERTTGDPDEVVRQAFRLHRLGFGLALDDVGSGNSGLELMRLLPLDFVKIDRSVVTNAPRDPRAQAVFMGIVAYARRLGTRVIAEGLEDAASLGVLSADADVDVSLSRDIHGAQGFLLGRPSARTLPGGEPRPSPHALDGLLRRPRRS
jgi:EAL domain-containing protein (putative c-di-GMP-specific phosphodiesterase class I)/CheY-like chemotaxis protein